MQKSIFKLIIIGSILFLPNTVAAATEVIETSTPEILTTTEISTTTPSTTPSDPVPEPTPPSTTVNFTLRYFDKVIFQSPVHIATDTTFNYVDNTETKTGHANNTVLAALATADNSSEDFSINQINYYSWGGYFVKCLDLLNIGQACDNWQYTVNHAYANIGADAFPIQANDDIYFYYGERYRITTPTNTYTSPATATAKIEEYNYTDNTYQPVPSIILGLLDSNQIELATGTSNNDGEVVFSITVTGTYQIGMQNISDYGNYYWPKTNVLTVTTTINTTSTTTSTSNTGGSGGSTANTPVETGVISESIQKLLNFLRSKQDATGKIYDISNSDWSALAFAANGIYPDTVITNTTSLMQYIYNTDPSNELNMCAAYPRHIMALLAGGVENTNNKIVELKNKIITQCDLADNYGSDSEINDDVFGLIALLATGETADSPFIAKIITAITNKQQADGAFVTYGWAGADITGAAINALKYAQDHGAQIDPNIFNKAKQYLKSTQLADGGWGFTSSDALNTSWALMGINSLGDNPENWFNLSGKNPWHPLTTLLNANGYYESEWSSDGIDWFGTKHSVPALLGKSWPIILPSKTLTFLTNNSATTYSTPTTTPIVSSTLDTTTTLFITSTTTPPTSTTITQTEVILIPTSTEKNTPTTTPHHKSLQKLTGRTNAIPNATSSPNLLTQTNTSSPMTPPSTTSNIAKQTMFISGGGVIILGLYLGLKLFKTLI